MRGRLRLSNRMILTSIALIALLLPIVYFGPFEANAVGEAMFVWPASIVDLALTAGKSFYAYVNVSSVTNMLGYKFILSYNTFVLTATNTTELSPFTNKLALEINDRTGYVSASYDQSPPAGFTGSQAVIKIGFKVAYTGLSTLDLHDTSLWDLPGAPIVHSVTDGYFRNVDLPKIPTASFTRNVTNPLDGQGIRFDATASTGGTGTISKYSWDFGTDIDILPDGDGTYTAWTGTYRDWYDPLDVYHDSDNSAVSAKALNINESSTLANPPTFSTIRDHTIRGVRLTVVSKNVGSSDEKIRAMLVIGGKGYNGTLSQPSSDYVGVSSVIVSEWATNPATAAAWTWANIDSLEAGVRSQRTGAAFSEVRVTQLYVTVLITTVDYNAPKKTADYYYRYRGNYTVNLGVYNEFAVGAAQTTVNVRGHDVGLTKFTHGSYKLLNPIANNFSYMVGSYTDWDDWPNPDNEATMVKTRPVVNLKPAGAGTYKNWTMISISPEAPNGTYTAWTGTYAEWDDSPNLQNDGDTTRVVATAGNLNESSTLVNPPGTTPPRGYAIDRVRLTIFARYSVASDEQVRLMLVIGGKGYNGSLYSLTTAYLAYTSDWATNPATAAAWTWTDIDNLQAGVRSQLVGSWTGEIRITQLYVSISTSGDYTAWSDYPDKDDDISHLSATVNNLIETSTMTNHNVSQNWPIHKIRVNFVSRNPNGASDEKVQPVLFIGGTLYYGGTTRPGNSYSGLADFSEFFLNPKTNLAWTWADLDALEAGFKSVIASGAWTGELKITQMWIGVFADIQTSKMTQRVTETWDIQNVTINVVARSNITTDDEIQTAMLTNNTFYPSIQALSTIISDTGWIRYRAGLSANPWTGQPWAWDEINTLRFGVQQHLVGVTWEGEYQITQLYVEVYGYIPPGTYAGVGLAPTYTILKMCPNEALKAWVTVENQGNFAESNVGVTLRWNSTTIETKTITSLGVGDVVTLEFTWTINTPYNRTFILNARTSTITGEYDTADNTIGTLKYGGLTRDSWVKVKLAGDANGDGFVNSLDIGKLNSHWSPASGTPAWSKGYSFIVDPNEDGYINSLDMGVVNANWGRKYP